MQVTCTQLILAMLFVGASFANDGFAQAILDQRITLQVQEKDVRTVLHEIEKQSDARFVFSSRLIQTSRKVSISASNEALATVLNRVLKPLQIEYEVAKKLIMLRRSEGTGFRAPQPADNPEQVAERTLTGAVIDEKGEGLPGVSVVLKGSQRGTTTDVAGSYRLSIPDDATEAVLVFSFVGFLSQEVAVGNQSAVNVTLKPDTRALDEVVVVGYGTQSRRNVTGSVAKVDMKQVENLPNTNVTQALRGRVAGVQFTDNGRPGQGGSILVRGTRSITANNDPLIILDGVFYNGNLADINPNDIETMEILKDASSAAIYGSRAANGVILITSKKGTTEKPTIRFNAYAGLSDWSHRIKLLSPERYIEKTLDVRRQSGQTADPAQVASYLQNTEAENFRNGVTIDPWDEISQQGSIQSYDISVSGRTGRTSYFISTAQVYEKGLIFNDNANRTSFRINLENNITDWLRVGVTSQYARRDLSGKESDTGQGYTLSPFGKLYFDEAKTDPVPYPVDDQIQRSPIFYPMLDKDQEIKHNLFANFYATVDVPFVKGLTYRVNYSPNYRWEHRYTSSPIYRRNGLNNLGSASKYNREDFDWVLENIVTYSRQLAPDHDLDLTLLYGRNQRYWESTNANGSNFFTDVLSWNNLNLAQVQQAFSNAQQVDGVSSMARLNYRFRNRYLLTLTARRDGSSVFGASHKYGTFPSAALAWIASDEPFMQKLPVFNLLKLRLSVGSVGNQAIAPYGSLSTAGTTQYVYGDGGATVNAVYTATMANQDLRWETTVSSNAAVDFELMKGRIGGTLEYYHMNTRDLLLNRALPSPTGFAQVLTNLGATRNTGFEFTLNTSNVRSGKFEWSTNLNFSTNRNRITHLYGSDLNNDGREDDDLGNRWFIGQPININYDYVFDGVYQVGDELPPGYKPGFLRFKDLNQDGKLDASDRTIISQREPKYRWGVNNTLRYGNLSLSVFLNAMQGWQQSFYLLDPVNNYPNRPVNMLDAGWWTAENKSTTRPSLVYTNPLGYGYYTSRDFVRIQDVSLAYDFPKPLLSRLKVNSLRAYVSGKNLHTFTNYVGQDPESGYNWAGYPTARSFTAGINLSF
ncbi:TonB-dependent receptor [Spirosoma sordidisoli]|nr:TonB-dependent receptor [Spirosoma sordidisoli]